MSGKAKRDNSYYEKLLKIKNRSIYNDWRAGRYSTLAEACIAAGIKKRRTRLQELKNAWNTAPQLERDEFLSWLASEHHVSCTDISVLPGMKTITPPVLTPKVFSKGRRLEPWVVTRLLEIVETSKFTTGDILRDLGFNPLNPSLGHALYHGHRLQPDVLEALEIWLDAYDRA